MTDLDLHVPAPSEEALAGLQRRLVAAAQEEGLVDVAYTTVDSPLGRLLLAATPNGLARIAFPNQPSERVLQELAERVSPRILETRRPLETVRRELDEYFEGRRRRFDVPVDLALTRGFRREVLEILSARVGYGEVTTYTEVAAAAARPTAVRAAASALATNPIPIVIPCHRVVRRGGALAGYAGGLERKAQLLELEGR